VYSDSKKYILLLNLKYKSKLSIYYNIRLKIFIEQSQNMDRKRKLFDDDDEEEELGIIRY
jgi:hypothetical protein